MRTTLIPVGRTLLAALRTRCVVTDPWSTSRAYLQALADVRSWHRGQISQSFGDVQAMQARERAIAWLKEVIAAKKRYAAEDEADRQRARAANSQTGGAQV